MPSGYKAKVVNAGASVVAEATESGGTALVDCSRYEEENTGAGATEIVPLGGWPTFIVTDSSDVTQATFSGAVYPGDVYSFNAASTLFVDQIIHGVILDADILQDTFSFSDQILAERYLTRLLQDVFDFAERSNRLVPEGGGELIERLLQDVVFEEQLFSDVIEFITCIDDWWDKTCDKKEDSTWTKVSSNALDWEANDDAGTAPTKVEPTTVCDEPGIDFIPPGPERKP
jgi:hypothetical protein